LILFVLCAATLTACSSRPGITPVRTAFNRGAYHFSQGNLDAAIHEYRQAVRNEPSDAQARFNLALALEAKARRVESEKQQALRRQAEDTYQQLLDHHPDHLRGNVNLAALQAERDNFDAARQRLRRMMQVYPDHPLPRTALAAHHLERDELSRAVALLQKAKRLDPAGVRLNMLLGRAYAKQGALDRAVEAYRRALETDPEDLATLLALAKVQKRRGAIGDAIASLRQMLLIDADHWHAHRILAGLLQRRGDWAAAAEHWRRARQLDHQRPNRKPRPDYNARLQSLYQKLAARSKPDRRAATE
jgi:tetratricopeptide (TPR) repeat protein